MPPPKHIGTIAFGVEQDVEVTLIERGQRINISFTDERTTYTVALVRAVGEFEIYSGTYRGRSASRVVDGKADAYLFPFPTHHLLVGHWVEEQRHYRWVCEIDLDDDRE